MHGFEDARQANSPLLKGIFLNEWFMQMAGWSQLTLFDQMNMAWNTPFHNHVVNSTYYDTRHFAKLVMKFVLEVIWSPPPNQGISIKLKRITLFWDVLLKHLATRISPPCWDATFGSRV